MKSMSKLKTFGTLLLAGSLTPAGVLFAQSSATANPAMSTHTSQTDPAATSMSARHNFTRIQDLAQNVRKDVAPLKFKPTEPD